MGAYENPRITVIDPSRNIDAFQKGFDRGFSITDAKRKEKLAKQEKEEALRRANAKQRATIEREDMLLKEKREYDQDLLVQKRKLDMIADQDQSFSDMQDDLLDVTNAVIATQNTLKGAASLGAKFARDNNLNKSETAGLVKSYTDTHNLFAKVIDKGILNQLDPSTLDVSGGAYQEFSRYFTGIPKGKRPTVDISINKEGVYEGSMSYTDSKGKVQKMSTQQLALMMGNIDGNIAAHEGNKTDYNNAITKATKVAKSTQENNSVNGIYGKRDGAILESLQPMLNDKDEINWIFHNKLTDEQRDEYFSSSPNTTGIKFVKKMRNGKHDNTGRGIFFYEMQDAEGNKVDLSEIGVGLNLPVGMSRTNDPTVILSMLKIDNTLSKTPDFEKPKNPLTKKDVVQEFLMSEIVGVNDTVRPGETDERSEGVKNATVRVENFVQGHGDVMNFLSEKKYASFGTGVQPGRSIVPKHNEEKAARGMITFLHQQTGDQYITKKQHMNIMNNNATIFNDALTGNDAEKKAKKKPIYNDISYNKEFGQDVAIYQKVGDSYNPVLDFKDFGDAEKMTNIFIRSEKLPINTNVVNDLISKYL